MHHRTCPDDHAFADLGAWQNGDVHADPSVAPNGHGTWDAFIIIGQRPPTRVVVAGVDRAIRTDVDIVSDGQATVANPVRAEIDMYVLTNRQAAHIGKTTVAIDAHRAIGFAVPAQVGVDHPLPEPARQKGPNPRQVVKGDRNPAHRCPPLRKEC